MLTSMVCVAAGHRKVYVGELRKLDVHCRKLLRPMIGPPPGINWNEPWHDILHEWHTRIEQQLECNGFKIWSHKYLTEYWKFGNYVALLPEHRWIRRVLAWHPRQKKNWTSIYDLGLASTLHPGLFCERLEHLSGKQV